MQKYLLSSDGVKINYEVYGSNKAKKNLVFIHGFGGCLKAFTPLILSLQKSNYQIINIDLRSHGQSERPKNSAQYKIDYFINDLVEILKKEKVEQATIIGHCFGGILALILGAHHPQLVKSIVLINSSYKAPNFSKLVYNYFPLKGIIFFLLRFFPNLYIKRYPAYEKYERSGDFNVMRIGSDVLHTSPKSYLYIVREIAKLDLASELPKIKQNVLLIHGDKDHVFNLKGTFELKSKLQNAKLEIIKDANHLIVLGQRQKLLQILEENIRQKFI